MNERAQENFRDPLTSNLIISTLEPHGWCTHTYTNSLILIYPTQICIPPFYVIFVAITVNSELTTCQKISKKTVFHGHTGKISFCYNSFR